MGVPASEVGYTVATTRRETTKVHKNIWWHWGERYCTGFAWRHSYPWLPGDQRKNPTSWTVYLGQNVYTRIRTIYQSFLLPTDAQENCCQKSIKICIKITLAPTRFGVITIIRERALPDDGDHTETCLSSCNINVNFNTTLETIPLCVSW